MAVSGTGATRFCIIKMNWEIKANQPAKNIIRIKNLFTDKLYLIEGIMI